MFSRALYWYAMKGAEQGPACNYHRGPTKAADDAKRAIGCSRCGSRRAAVSGCVETGPYNSMYMNKTYFGAYCTQRGPTLGSEVYE